MRVFVTLLLLMCCPMSHTVFASDWVLVLDQEGFVTYLDESSVKAEGPLRRAWVKSIYPTHSERGGGKNSAKWVAYDLVREQFDCLQENRRTEAFLVYFDDGTDIDVSKNAASGWTAVPPDSLAGLELRMLCERHPQG